MKHFFSLLVAGAVTLSAGAQAVEGHEFLDNWSVGVYTGGAGSIAKNPFKNGGGLLGAELTKNLTPVFGFGVQATAGFGTTGSYTAVDNLSAMLIAKANVTNWIWTYQGQPRFFDVDAVVGIGVNHYFGRACCYPAATGNALASKLGLNFNFNLGKDKAWTVSVRPALAYDMEGVKQRSQVRFNANNGAFELTAGVVYHFKNSNGQRYFTRVKPYDKAEVDGLNAKINDLRATVAKKDKELRDKEVELRRVKQMLNDSRSERPAGQR